MTVDSSQPIVASSSQGVTSTSLDESKLSEIPGIADDGFSEKEQNSRDLEQGAQTPILVVWEPNDPENPFNWSRKKKWVVTVSACLLTVVSASTGGIVALGYPKMQKDLHSTDEQDAMVLAFYALGFAIAPLVLASFSEEYGRRPMYIVFSALFTIFFIPLALAQNIQTAIIARFFQGAWGSTGATMVGGTVADIWDTHERGRPMSMFAFAAVFSTGMGPVVAGWVEETLGWRWIEWITMCISGTLTIWLTVYGAQETRGSIILTRRAARLRKETGNPNYRTAFNSPDIKQLIWISVTRPMHLLCTEPVVLSFSIWVGFVWGCLYGLLQSVGLVFQTLYNFNSGETGLVFLTVALAAILGTFINIYQEKLYRKNVARIGAEARLYSAMGAGISVTVGGLIYAWTSYSYVHWIAPCIGITIMVTAIFTIYLAVFNYLADAYLIYASSALAGQSLFRNIFATIFPLIVDQMYKKLNFNWASTLLAGISLLLAPIPVVLFFYGPSIRARSRFAKKLAMTELK